MKTRTVYPIRHTIDPSTPESVEVVDIAASDLYNQEITDKISAEQWVLLCKYGTRDGVYPYPPRRAG